jgi:hypothetical protein
MKFIAIIMLAIVVIASSIFCLLCTTCAVTGSGLGSLSIGARIFYAVLALVALAVAAGAVTLIGKLQREI